MIEQCLLCGADHPFRECPMLSSTKTYLDAYAPKADVPIEEPTSSSLPRTQFEEMFGRGAEPLLQEVLDGNPEALTPEQLNSGMVEAPEIWSPEQQELALRILAGEKSVKKLSTEERSVLDDIARQLSWAPKAGQPTQEITPRNGHAFEEIPQLQMPALDRPAASSDEKAPIVVDEWPIKG